MDNRYIHTTDAELQPGDIIEPAATRKHRSPHRKLPHYDPNYVYVWNPAEAKKILFQQHGQNDYEVEPVGEIEPDTELLAGQPFPGSYRVPQARVIRQIPWGEDLKTSHTPAPDKHPHHTWVFDPVTGDAHISDDHDRERRHRGHHDELADKVGRHPDRIHGFAYRIHGGWRITDWDHKAVDHFVARRVIAALNEKEN